MVAFAIALRVWLAFGPLGGLDSDEAITGLMALRLLHDGQLSAFYWVSSTAVRSTLRSRPFRSACSARSTASLKAPLFVVGALISVLTWRIARRIMSPDRAIVAGLLSACWPIGIIWKATKVNAFYSTTVALGLGAWLLACSTSDERPRDVRLWGAMGLLCGAGVVGEPEHRRLRRAARALAVARAGTAGSGVDILVAAVGVGRWSGVVHRQPSQRSRFARRADWSGGSTYLTRLGFFVTDGLPFALGLRLPFDGGWVFGPLLTIPIYIAAAGFVVVVVARRLAERQSDAVLLALSPFVFAVFPGNWTLSDGRYLFFIAALLPVTVASVCGRTWMKTALVVFVAATLVGFAFDVDTLSDSTRPSTEPLAELLLERGYDTVVADYWIAYQMTFESNEEVLATPNVAIRDHRTALDVAASRPAFVFRESTPPAEYAWVVSNLDSDENPLRHRPRR